MGVFLSSSIAVLRPVGLLALALTLTSATLNAQVSPTAATVIRVQKNGQASADDIDRAATAFDDALRQAVREAAAGLMLPGQTGKLDAFIGGLTREQSSIYCTQAEALGSATTIGPVYQQNAAFAIRTEVLNRRLALATVGVKSVVGLTPPPRLFLAVRDSWNSSGATTQNWVIDKDTPPSRQQITNTLRRRYPDFLITEDNPYADDGENRDAILVKARNAGARLLLIGHVRSHQVKSASTTDERESSSTTGITANGNSNPLDKLNKTGGFNIAQPRIAVELEWIICDIASGAILQTIKAQRDPVPNEPSEYTEARRVAKTALVNDKLDELWMALITWNQKPSE